MKNRYERLGNLPDLNVDDEGTRGGASGSQRLLWQSLNPLRTGASVYDVFEIDCVICCPEMPKVRGREYLVQGGRCQYHANATRRARKDYSGSNQTHVPVLWTRYKIACALAHLYALFSRRQLSIWFTILSIKSCLFPDLPNDVWHWSLKPVKICLSLSTLLCPILSRKF